VGRQGTGVNAEQGVATRNFDVPIIKVEGVMEGYGRGVEGVSSSEASAIVKSDGTKTLMTTSPRRV